MSKEAQEGVKMQYSFTEILREGEGPNLEQKKNHYKTTHTGQNYFIDIEEVQ